MKTKFRWSNIGDPGKWDAGNSFYFPFAERFLRYCPWMAVRMFWLIIKIREFINA